jgi:tetrahydromethanopterin S-methyltransferase subunit C
MGVRFLHSAGAAAISSRLLKAAVGAITRFLWQKVVGAKVKIEVRAQARFSIQLGFDFQSKIGLAATTLLGAILS